MSLGDIRARHREMGTPCATVTLRAGPGRPAAAPARRAGCDGQGVGDRGQARLSPPGDGRTGAAQVHRGDGSAAPVARPAGRTLMAAVRTSDLTCDGVRPSEWTPAHQAAHAAKWQHRCPSCFSIPCRPERHPKETPCPASASSATAPICHARPASPLLPARESAGVVAPVQRDARDADPPPAPLPRPRPWSERQRAPEAQGEAREGDGRSTCRACGTPIIWLVTRAGKNCPVLPLDEHGNAVQPGEIYDPHRHEAHVGCGGVICVGGADCRCPSCSLDRHMRGAKCPPACWFCPAREKLRAESPWGPR